MSKVFREKLLGNTNLTIIPGGAGGKGSPVHNINADQMMDYLSVTNKRQSSVGITSTRSITVTNVDENTVTIEGFK